jgi:hypothetical protein
MQTPHIVPFTLFSLLFLSLDLAAQTQPPAYLKEYQSKGLPPLGQTVEFENTAAFPPQIKGQTQTETKPETQAAPMARTPEAVVAVRDIALGNAQLKKALGKSFSYLGSDDVPTTTDRSATSDAPTTVMRYYSYTRNRAIDVYIANDKVVEIRPRRQGYQPAETRDEVAEAAEIVRADKRYRSIVADLTARGLITPSENGHRHLYVLFYKEKNVPPAVFRATVDMTTRRVVNAQAVKRAQK